MHTDTCVIVPVYNEEQVVGSVIDDLAKYFRHVICVDDGSTDNSTHVVSDTTARLVRHARNQGQGAALRTGIKTALENQKIKYVVTFDADGQHSAKDADRMVRFIKKDAELDVVLGSRFLGEARDIGAVKLGVLRVAVIVSNVISGLKLTDTHNGLRVLNRDFAQNLRLKSTGMAHASEIIIKIARHSYAYAEHPVTITYTDYSKSKGQSIFNSFSILIEMLKQRTLKSWRA